MEGEGKEDNKWESEEEDECEHSSWELYWELEKILGEKEWTIG